MSLSDLATHPIHPQSASRLLSLPPELRLHIYTILVDSENGFRINDLPGGCVANRDPIIASHSLTRTSRLLHFEFDDIYQKALSWHRVRNQANRISACVTNFNFSFLRFGLDSIGTSNLSPEEVQKVEDAWKLSGRPNHDKYACIRPQLSLLVEIRFNKHWRFSLTGSGGLRGWLAWPFDNESHKLLQALEYEVSFGDIESKEMGFVLKRIRAIAAGQSNEVAREHALHLAVKVEEAIKAREMAESSGLLQ